MTSNPSNSSQEAPDYLHAALDALLRDIAETRKTIDQQKRLLSSNETRLPKLTEGARKLIEALPLDQRSAYTRQLDAAPPEDAPSRGGEVYGEVIDFLARKKAWSDLVTPAEVRSALLERGLKPDPKVISNIMTYLVRSKRLERVQWGHYRIVGEGTGLVTSDPIPGAEYGQTRTTEHER